jgi:hypothetical protein
MADANTEVNLAGMQAAMRAAIAAAFPGFVTVEFDRDDESERIPTPAFIAEFIEADPNPDGNAGTGQWPALARFDARIILDARNTSKMDVKLAATGFAAWINARRFSGIYADPAQVIACEPDEFAPHQDRFRTWRVEWVIPCMFGESVWKHNGTTPDAVFSFAPDIGAANEAAYRPVDPMSPVDPPAPGGY